MLKKIGLGIILTASFGLMSCEDSSSSSSGGKVTVSCKVVSEDPFTIKSSEAGIGGNMTYELKDGKVVETYKFDDSSIAKDECNDMKSRGGYSKVTCDGKKVVAYSEDEMTDAEFKQYKKSLKKYCEDMDGKTVDINDWGNPDDDVPTSSSSKATSSSAKSSTTTSSCEFKLNNDVWEYSYATEKDASGTSAALPAGVRDEKGVYDEIGKRALFWWINEYADLNVFNIYYDYSRTTTPVEVFNKRNYAVSVRCVK